MRRYHEHHEVPIAKAIRHLSASTCYFCLGASFGTLARSQYNLQSWRGGARGEIIRLQRARKGVAQQVSHHLSPADTNTDLIIYHTVHTIQCVYHQIQEPLQSLHASTIPLNRPPSPPINPPETRPEPLPSARSQKLERRAPKGRKALPLPSCSSPLLQLHNSHISAPSASCRNQ